MKKHEIPDLDNLESKDQEPFDPDKLPAVESSVTEEEGSEDAALDKDEKSKEANQAPVPYVRDPGVVPS